MDSLETFLRPLTSILNRNIGESTPARELCEQLDGKVIAIQVRDTSLAMYFHIEGDTLTLKTDYDEDPDVVITGSLLSLMKMAGPSDDDDAGALRAGSIDISGDAFTAQHFQKLLRFARPDLEEELSHFVGDAAAHRAGQFARAFRAWAKDARTTAGANIREYLQEESRDVPSRYEAEKFADAVDALRDDVARFEARMNRLAGGT